MVQWLRLPAWNAGDMGSIVGQDLGSPIPCSMAKNKRKKQISYGLQEPQRGYWGEDLFFFFWLYHVAYGISVPWPGSEPRPQLWNPGILTTGPPVVGDSLYLSTKPTPPHTPFLNSQEDMFLLLPFGVFETTFTQILVVNIHPLGIHVALSGWVVLAHLNGWSRRNVHK